MVYHAPMSPWPTRQHKWLLGVLGVLAMALWATAVPAAFTIDDCNYFSSVVALRHGGLTIPGTAGLSPTRELLPYEPVVQRRVVEATPVAPTVPPLYAPFALLAWPLGWRGLVLMNVVAFGVVGWLVFQLAAHFGRGRHTPWLALAAFVLGGFSLDYAQGAWPQMLSAALTTAALWFTVRALRTGAWATAALAGLLAGVAAGVRYQNAVFGAALGLCLLLWARRRWATAAGFAAAATVPMACSSLINYARLGLLHPLSKGPSYLQSSSGSSGLHPVFDALLSLWVRVVDYSAHPPFTSAFSQATLPKDPTTGVFLVVGGLKKALLQSAPWAVVAIAALLWACLPRNELPSGKRGLFRVLAIVAGAVLALFAWAGLARHDGWSFNQRYLLELVPLFAVAFALAVDHWRPDGRAVTVGGAVGLALATIPLSLEPEQPIRQLALMYAPLVLATTLLAAWLVAAGRCSASAQWLGSALLAACIAWAFAVHLGDDMRWARARRDFHRFQYEAIAPAIPAGPVALFANPMTELAACRLYFDHDIVIVDPFGDAGHAASDLTDEFFSAGRAVIVVGGSPTPILRSIFEGRAFRLLASRPIPLGRVLPSPTAPSSAQPVQGSSPPAPP